MINLYLVIFTFFIGISGSCQETNDLPCYEVQYLDFFGLEDLESVKWSQSETDGIKGLALRERSKDSSESVNFIVPMIAHQLQEFHPNCVENSDSEYLARLIDTYWTIRQINQNEIKNSSIEDQIDFVRDDFYSLVSEDKNLSKMTVTFDDGPFYGVDTEVSGTFIESIETDFGKLIISNLDGKSVLAAIDKNGEVIWHKVITGLYDNTFSELKVSTSQMKQTSLATIVFFSAGGEQLTLYVKNDGRFMYYMHSW